MELGRIERLRASSDAAITTAVGESRRLVDSMVRTVRDLALGLRPSMLDDFGLQPALEWHVRDVSRRYGLPVELTMHGDFDVLPDAHRTCVYRAVQEALTNCVRHAHAQSVAVVITAHASELEVSVTDDGIGLPRARKTDGLGLRGIEERVKKLDGVLQIRAAPGRGTTLALRVPLPVDRMDVPLARAAG
jgi:signal transduction histidine kinase